MAFTKVTDPTNNVSSLANQPVESPSTLKAVFDEIGKDLKTYINDVLTVELESTTNGDSGADNVGATPLVGGTADDVQGILEELDAKAVSGSGALNAHKTSSDHDGRYYTEGEVAALLLANQQGNHLGTWQGYSPVQTDPGIQSIVNQHTDQLNDLSIQNSNKKLKIIAGAIRNSGSGFNFINDANHNPIGVLSVTNDGTSITINYNFTAKKVISFTIVPDETMASKGIFLGASVGLTSAIIDVYKSDDIVAYITKSGGGIPVYTLDSDLSKGVSSVAPLGGATGIEVIHDELMTKAVSGKISNRTTGQAYGNIDAFISSYAANKCEIKFVGKRRIGANIYYDGSTWIVNGNTNLIASWNAGANRLEISFQSVGDYYPIFSATPKDSLYRPVIGAYGFNVAYVKFYNSADVLITTQDTSMNIFFTLQDDTNNELIPPDGTNVVLERKGFGLINPNNLTFPSSNFWFYGVMETE